MDPEEKDAPEVLETPEEEKETPETPEEETLTAEQIAELKAKAAKADELESKNKQLFERAKKAETAKTAVPSKDDDALSTRDVLYLAKADIHEDDVNEVLEYAKKMGVSVADAHKHYKPILAERAEERKTAAAAHTRGAARGSSKVAPEDVLRKAERGEVLDSADDMRAIFAARQARRIQK